MRPTWKLKKIDIKNKRILFTVIVVLILLIISIAITSGQFNVGEPVEAVAQSDHGISRCGDIIGFCGKDSKGDIKEYSWDFGDGNQSDEMNPSNIYNESGWFNVTLKVVSPEGRSDSVQLEIGIQRMDRLIEETFGRTIELNPGARQGRGPVIHAIRPNIGTPSVSGDWLFNDAIGTFTLEVLFFTEEVIVTYKDEMRTATFQDIRFNLEIPPDDLPEDIVSVHATVWVEQGGWNGGLFTFVVVYPVTVWTHSRGPSRSYARHRRIID